MVHHLSKVRKPQPNVNKLLLMKIDFEKIAEEHLQGFKGGDGKLDTRNYVDDKARIKIGRAHV